MPDADHDDDRLHTLFMVARRRMCEIVQEQPAPDIMREEAWKAHLTPEHCNPGGIYQHEDEPWWWHWYAWSPDGQFCGVADDKSEALDRVTAVWSDWL